MRRRFVISFFLLIIYVSYSKGQLLEALPRHAYWGAAFNLTSGEKPTLTVTAITPAGFAESIGLQKGDVIQRVNGMEISNRSKYYELFYSARHVKGNSQVNIELVRDGKAMQKKGIVPPRPLESFKGVITEYKSIQSPYGYRVQVIITRPEGTTGKIPGIFFVRWMSCDAIEKPVSRKHGVARMLEDLILKSGFAVIRVEKPGFGDSEGPCCYDADFKQELAAHQEAYRLFRQLDFIDPTKIIVFGQSNGAAYAPMVTGADSPAGIIASGVWTKTWYEHMLEYSRRDMELNKVAPSEITRRMKLITEFYTDYLIHKKLPGDIIKEKPQLKEAWSDEYDHQWDLPAQYVQQLQDLDVAGSWSKVKSPAYVFYGEYDFAMVESDHQWIVRTVKENGSSARYEFIPKMDHSLFSFENAQDAMTDFYGKGSYHEDLALKLIAWMKEVVK